MYTAVYKFLLIIVQPYFKRHPVAIANFIGSKISANDIRNYFYKCLRLECPCDEVKGLDRE